MRRSTPEGHRRLVGHAAEIIAQCGGFPCHDKHPTKHALTPLTDGTTAYESTDCVGYKMFLANKKTPGRFPEIVDTCQQLEIQDGCYKRKLSQEARQGDAR
jgi:hypothetical protein